MLTAFLRALSLALIVAGLAACKDKDRRRDRDRDEPRQEEPAEPVDPTAFNFRTDSGTGAGREPTPNTFVIPRCADNNDKLGYVVTRFPAPLAVGATMRLEYTMTMSADAVIIDHEDRRSTPGRMALYFQRQGDDMGQRKYDAGYRQWSLPRQTLVAGPNVFEVVLVKENFNFPDGFDATMRYVENAGFTLAGLGGPSAGHGVCMKQGTATLTVTSLSVR